MISYNTSIVRNGLVLHLDAANVKSYLGTGNTVTDISNSKTSLQLYDAGGYNAIDKSFSFVYQSSGIATNWITTSTFNTIPSGIINEFTYCGFYRVTNAGSTRGWTFDDFDSDTTNRLNFYPTQYGAAVEINNNATFPTPSLSGLAGLNKWVYYGYQISNNGTIHTMFRWNFITQSFEYSTTTSSPAVATIGSYVTFGRRGYQSNNYCGLDIGPQMMYNRSLSNTEISQNFNATRGRYGI